MKRMAALLAVAGLIASSAVPATAGAQSQKCGGTHYVLFLPIPFC
jgi:hypothetical protein